MAVIGVSAPRRDSEPKVRGTVRFAADGPVVGLLHARLVLAHEAHAMISGIRTDAATAIPGVVAVLTADDLPLVGTGPGRLNEPLAREEVVYAGQPVALVVPRARPWPRTERSWSRSSSSRLSRCSTSRPRPGPVRRGLA